jgi:hypothetical protein
MVMDKNIETKVAKTILQEPEEVVIGDTTYRVANPSTATLILMSEAVAKMPQVNLTAEKVVDESLYIAKDCRIEGEIVAIMILGAKGLMETRKVRHTEEKRRLWGLWKQRYEVETEETINHKAILAKKLLEDVSPRELMNITSRLLQGMQIADFFGLTTFLIEINLLRQTKVGETTASGQ